MYSGTKFVEKITAAIADSKILLFVSSVNSNASEYTPGEIIEAKDRGRLIIPVRIDNTGYSDKFRILVNSLDYIDYYKSDSLSKLLKAITQEKARLAVLEEEERRRLEEECRKRKEMEQLQEVERRRREEEEKMTKRAAVLAKVEEIVVQVENHQNAQHNFKANAYRQLHSINIIDKRCTVCHTQCSIESDFCSVCGWRFSPLSQVAGLKVKESEDENNALELYSAAWEKSKTASDDVVRLRNDINTLKDKYKQLQEKEAKDETLHPKWLGLFVARVRGCKPLYLF